MASTPHFPSLPARRNQIQWTAEIVAAHQHLQNLWSRARSLLQLECPDPVRAQVVVSSICKEGVALLEALEDELPNEGWVIDCAKAVFHVAARLRQSAGVAEGIESEQVEMLVGVTQASATGRHGRPRKQFDQRLLRDALAAHRKISIAVLADALKVHHNTLRKHLKLHGIYQRFSKITDAEIDRLIRGFRKAYPKSGIRYAIGFLKRNSVRVPRHRVIASLKRVNPVAQRLRTRVSIARREYRVSRPNALWHMDGHHKLIRWGIVIHGFIDGYSRKIMALQASPDNTARTVLNLFLEAVEESGFPWRVRGDRGSENVQVSVCMILFRGLNRGSFIWGTSTRNTRAERLWVEVGTQFARAWRAFFTRLERLHRLNCGTQGHLWLLRRLFLTEVNEDCKSFQLNWNNHPVSRLGHDQTPEDMFLLGQLRHGKYPEPSEPHPTVHEEYGTTPEVRRRIGKDLAQHVHHDAVAVPDDQSPFTSGEATNVFNEALEKALQTDVVPKGFFLFQDEWADLEYPSSERIKVARKEVDIPLPFDIWYPRAVRWAQALKIMVIVQDVYPTHLTWLRWLSLSDSSPLSLKDANVLPGHPKVWQSLYLHRETHRSSEGSRKKVVLKILETFALDKPLSTATTSNQRSSQAAVAARAETNAGFRPKQHALNAAPTDDLQKKASSSKLQRDNRKSGRTSKVGKIIVIPCGIKYNKGKGDLREQRAPSQKTLEEFREFGLVVDDVNGVPPEFRLEWSHSDIDAWLRSLFPQVFQYLDRFGPLPNGDYHWKLAGKEYQSLFLYDRTKLTGDDLFKLRGSSAKSYRERQLRVVTVRAIPQEVYSNWTKALSEPLPSMSEIINLEDSDNDDIEEIVSEPGRSEHHDDTDANDSDIPPIRRSRRLRKRGSTPTTKSQSPPASPPPARRVNKGKAKRLSFSESEGELAMLKNLSDASETLLSPRSIFRGARTSQKRKRALSTTLSMNGSPNENDAKCDRQAKRHKGWVSQYSWQPPDPTEIPPSPQPPSSPSKPLKFFDNTPAGPPSGHGTSNRAALTATTNTTSMPRAFEARRVFSSVPTVEYNIWK